MPVNLTGAMSHVQRANALTVALHRRMSGAGKFDIGVRRGNINSDGSTVGCTPRAV
jgi:hypothetical protein